ncbi:nuclear protein localization protein 4 homolog [Littorina saxatilis]|uniref:Nuclear protein localization protein 4 homolog n=1 Tax=Littorina saxatilis TaxID=31220 RepID=A0AAN9BTT0_9CAEN
MSKQIIIRVQSPDHGTKRIEIKTTESIASFLNKVQSLFELGDTGWSVYANRDGTGFIRNSRAKKVSDYKIKHGDMLYMTLEERANSAASMGGEGSEAASFTLPPPATDPSKPSASPSGGSQVITTANGVQEDEVDVLMTKQDGKIYRDRNEQLCRHGPKGKCLHCVPLEPYDEQFLKSCDPPIKFLSFHSYIRKLTGGVDRGKFVNLENISCKIKPGCKEHPPWPGGICTKCQPNAVTLNRQTYRHVDYIMFENPMVADRFLNYWRRTGNQRIGIMYGRYEPHKDFPLGIKATIAAIYEPPQSNAPNRIELLPDPKEKQVSEVAKRLGLRPVGWIFTDLVAEDLSKGTVKNFRGNIDSHFLSAEECIMAADFQNKYPNPCKLSPEGHFGSKFVTVIATGDNNNQIHFEGYQVSNQCMALVKDDCLIPTKDVPELGYVKESSNEQYIPDVFYKGKDSYGNEVTHLARPLPVEYLLVDMPAAFPSDFEYSFKSGEGRQTFPAENREHLGETQDFNSLVQYMEQFSPNQFLVAISDFHLLVFLSTSEIIPVREKLGLLLDAVKNQDEETAHQFKKTEEWATVEEMMSAHAPSPTASRQAYVGPGAAPLPPISGGGTSGAMWTCNHCTFLNEPGLAACEMCSLPHSSGPSA